MKSYAFISRDGTRVNVPEDQINGLGLDSVGYCLNCGLDHNGIEPDACKYLCDDCGKRSVYGAEEIMMAGLLT